MSNFYLKKESKVVWQSHGNRIFFENPPLLTLLQNF